ncbi:restriction endonuclease subunit S [Alkalicoccobacillus porphyridii]|uniref:Restriction endonuclease subunit S n=1 Tax=Alkalicoccobacillus porphyridii TaxID=2597270 RepID=A0A553ZW54_9BACI|nr:restriction endonuclease subunit S [Alkalicoccobacillus porphyridii]TSB45575.1 restriction endonuclease subunit S [Alkalicoccobacillus porphyridii]
MSNSVVSLVSICDFQGGTQPPKSQWKTREEDGYIRMLQIRDFTQGRNEKGYVPVTANLKTCKEQDILIARYGASVGKILTGQSGAYNVAIIKTIPDEEKVLKRYLFYYLKSDIFQNFVKNVGTRAAQAGFNKQDLESLNIFLPSLSGQQQIIDLLEKAEMLIYNRKEQISAIYSLIQNVFLQMFGDPVINSNKYKSISLKEICKDIKGGGTPSKSKPEYYTGDIPWVTPKDMKMMIIEDSIDHINDDAINNSSTKLIPPNSLLMVIRSGILKRHLPVAINKNSVTLNQDMKAFIPNNNIITAEYLLLFFQNYQRILLSQVRSVTADNLDFNQIKSIEVPIPPIEKQNEFSKFFNETNRLIKKVEKQIEIQEELYKSLLQRAFKGEL